MLLLDEPLGALDLKLRKALQIELKRVQVEVGITFVYVTHDQEEALTMSDRIAVMRGGKVEQLGTPEELYERPAHAVRRRLHRHVQPAQRDRSSRSTRGEPSIRLSSGETCQTAAGIGRHIGRAVELSVRPEAIALTARNGGDDSSDPRSIPGAIEQVAYLGGNVQYLVRTAGGLSITALASEDRRLDSRSAAPSTSPGRPATHSCSSEQPAAQEEIPA